MPMNKKIIMPLAALAVVGAGVWGASQASAASEGTDRRDSLIQKLADKLGVDKAKVQAVFDEDRTARQAEHEQAYADRLKQAVTDGKLTQAQADKVAAEHKALKAKMDAAMDKTGTDRRDAMEAIRDEGQAWAKANDIDAKWLVGGMGGRGGHGPMDGKMGGKMGERPERPADAN